MDVRADPRSTALWSLGFAAGYLVLTVAMSLLAGHQLHLAAWLPAGVLWLVGVLLDGAYLSSWVSEPRPPSRGRPARVEALRWVLCVLTLANAALLLWRAVVPGHSTLVVAGFDIRLLPLDVRLVPAGLDLLALALGVGLGFLGLCELRLRLAPPVADAARTA